MSNKRYALVAKRTFREDLALGSSVNRGDPPPRGIGEVPLLEHSVQCSASGVRRKGPSHEAQTQEETQVQQRGIPTREGCCRSPDYYRAGLSYLAPVGRVLGSPLHTKQVGFCE